MILHCKYDELVNPKTLKNHPKNRNKHGQDQIERLAELYQYHGIRHPIIVSKRSNFIVAGHGRKLAAIRAGIDEMPVVYQDFKDEASEYAFIQSDNAIALWAELDMAGINMDMAELGPDFDINMLGIKDFTLDFSEKYQDKDADEVPDEVEPQAKLGQIYQLGQHRLMCGDSTDEATVSKLMNGEKADMVFTDPPYNVAVEGKFTGKIENDSMSPEAFREFLNKAFARLKDSIKSEAPLYICYEIKNHSDFETGLVTNGFKFDEVIVWNKDSASFYNKNKYNRKFEAIFFVSNESDPICSAEVNVWDAPKSSSFNSNDENGKKFNQPGNFLVAHPTTKPILIIERALNNHKKNAVLDLFGGSGSTLIACEKTNRKCFMMELDPHYIDVIIARWEKFTGKTAELISG